MSAIDTARHGDPFVGAVGYVIDSLEDSAYTDRPGDAGGPTKFGVSQRGNPGVDIEGLTRDDAIRIYHEQYWRACHADLMPAPIALMMFAAFVNMAPRRAVQCLQEAAQVKADGLLGPKTLFAVQHYNPQRELRARFSRACAEFYIGLVRRYPVNTQWLHGWLGRVCRVADEAGAWGSQE